MYPEPTRGGQNTILPYFEGVAQSVVPLGSGYRWLAGDAVVVEIILRPVWLRSLEKDEPASVVL